MILYIQYICEWFKIEQAIAGATKKVAAEKLKEERKVDRQQKRTRVTVKIEVPTNFCRSIE